MSAADPINEYLVQPRTGSQCTSTANPASGWTTSCQTDKINQYGWTEGHGSAALTLGFIQEVDGLDATGKSACRAIKPFSGPDGKHVWTWGNLNGSSQKTYCIQPVEQLCYLDGPWSGANYDPKTWPTTKLKDAFVSVNFTGDCDQSTHLTQYGGETATLAQMCPLQCTYDATQFKTLEQIAAYEQKYGKYRDDTSGCFGTTKSPATFTETRNCLGATSGTAIQNPSNQRPYTDNYEKIMIRFCSQKQTGSACPTDPATGKQTEKCSYLMSTGPEGEKCKAWLNTYGPYKFSIMDSIGNYYCTTNPDSYDCRCYSRNDPGNPDSQTFQNVSNAITQLPTGTPAACYYIPCADATNYIIPSSIFGVPQSPATYEDPGYGFFCESTVCADIINGSNANIYMSGNTQYIQCPPSSGSGGGGGKSGDKTNNNVFSETPVVFTPTFWDEPTAKNIGFIVLIIVSIFIFVYLVHLISQLSKQQKNLQFNDFFKSLGIQTNFGHSTSAAAASPIKPTS